MEKTITKEELISTAISCGWEENKATTGDSWFSVLRRGRFEIWVEANTINIMENDGNFGFGRGMVEVSRLKTREGTPWIFGLFGPVVGRWFSLKANRFLYN